MQRKSILNKVILLNIIMTLIVSTLFIVSSSLYSKQLAKERYNLAHTTLSKLNKDFQIEMHRLDTLLTLCLQDSSIVFTISDKLDSDFFLENSTLAASKLSLMRQSLPYARSIFLFTANSNQIIRDNGGIYTNDIFIKEVLNRPYDIDFQESSLDLSHLPDGLFRYNHSNALYVKNLYGHGYVAVQIDLSNFANINNTYNDDFIGYVIRNDGVQIIENAMFPLSEEELAESLTQNFITLEGSKYYCSSSPMQIIPYTGLVLINNDSLMQPLNYLKTIMWITLVILFASSFILMALNYKIYLPLKKITSQFKNSEDNEISVIEKKIHELLFEINTLKENSQTADIVPEKIALYYLISGGTQLNEATMQLLEKSFPYYMLITFTLQKNTGEEDLYFASLLEKELSARFKINFISITKYKFSIIAKPEEKESMIAYLEMTLNKADCDLQVFAGIREYCMDIKELYTEYKLAENALLSAKPEKGKAFFYSEQAVLPQNLQLSADVRQHLFEYARNQAIPQLKLEIDKLLYPACGCSLSAFKNYYHELLSIFEKTCISLNLSCPDFANESESYNTDHMYQSLNAFILQLFASKHKQAPDMKQRMEEYIFQHMSEPLTLDTVADAFSITISEKFIAKRNTFYESLLFTAGQSLLCQRFWNFSTGGNFRKPCRFSALFTKGAGK